MSRRYWIALAAIGLSVLCASVEAQEHQPEAASQAAEERDDDTGFPVPLPVQILEGETERDARLRREREARQLQTDDLAAQRAMNEASLRMARAAETQSWIVGIGTVLLLATVILTAWASYAAHEAVRVTRDLGRKQVCAYPGIQQVKVGTSHESLTANFLIQVHNAGQSPALNGLVTIRVFTKRGAVFGFAAFREIGAGISQTQTVRLNTKDLTEIETKDSPSGRSYGLFDAVFVSEDVFHDSYETQYRGILSFGWDEDILGIHIEPATNAREDISLSASEHHAIERDRLRRQWREMEQRASSGIG